MEKAVTDLRVALKNEFNREVLSAISNRTTGATPLVLAAGFRMLFEVLVYILSEIRESRVL